MIEEKTDINIVAVIVAAGLSSRMNAFKPMLPIGVGNVSVIQQSIDTFRKAGIQRIVVIVGHNAAMLNEHLKNSNVETKMNAEYATTDMFYSVKIGMRTVFCRSELFFFLPVDVPLFSKISLEKMINYQIVSNSDIVIPVYDNKAGHPLLIKNSLIPYLLEYTGKDGLRGAIRSIKCKKGRIIINDQGISMDIDKPEDYQKLKKYAQEMEKWG